MNTKILAIILILLASAGLGSARDRGLGEARWELTRVNNRVAQNTAAYLEMDLSEGRFSGNGGCNQMFGTFQLKGDRITFSRVGLTRRMCKLPAGAPAEHTVVRALESTARYQRVGRALTFYDRRGRKVLEFRSEAGNSGQASLATRKWMLESIGPRESAIGVKDAFLVFDEQKKSAGGNSGCNVYGGTYKTRGETISITDVISTMRACEEGDRMTVERALFGGLRRADRYVIRDGKLQLYRGRNLLLTFRGERKDRQ